MHDYHVRNSHGLNQYYEYRHVVEYHETDIGGPVYNVNCLRWQVQCREMFLLEHVPDVLDELCGAFEMVTIAAEFEPLEPIAARDTVSIRMRAEHQALTQLTLAFDYVRSGPDGEVRVAKGRHTVACMMSIGGTFTPVRVPESLRIALGRLGAPRVLSLAGTGGRA
jgi:enediyne core biosynthesis thioesterase